MNYRQRVWLFIALLASCCAALVGGAAYLRARRLATPAALLERLPARDATILFLDFAALRRSGLIGLLSGSPVSQEPEYRAFVHRTQFDYSQDLDTAVVGFTGRGTYFLLRGRFDWKRLQEYAREQGGKCNYTFCSMDGSTPERKISYFPLEKDVMALAVSTDESAAEILSSRHGEWSGQIPQEPAWMSMPGPALSAGGKLPEGTRLFATAMRQAQRLTLSLGPRGTDFEVRLGVNCASEQAAAGLEKELERTTSLLRDMILREQHAPNPQDLSGVLTEGSFRHEGSRVFGSWPVRRSFLEQIFTTGSS